MCDCVGDSVFVNVVKSYMAIWHRYENVTFEFLIFSSILITQKTNLRFICDSGATRILSTYFLNMQSFKHQKYKQTNII